MSIIHAARVHVVHRSYDRTYFNAAMRWNSRHIVLVRLETGDGLTGWGECWCLDRSAEALVQYLQSDILPALLGTQIGQRRRWHERMRHLVNLGGRSGLLGAALSGVDIAMWDLAAREAGRPLHRLLGGQGQTVAVYAAGGLYRDGCGHDPGPELAAYLERGFEAVKMKLGAWALEDDVERLSSVRSAIGPRAGLIVDMSYSLNWDRARSWIPFLRSAGVAAIQSPFPVWEWDLMARLSGLAAAPVIGLEAEARHDVLRHLLAIGALDILQISPTAAGGVTGAQRLVELAATLARPITLQCSTSAIAYAACLHIASAFPEQVESVECNMIHDTFYERLPRSALEPVGGRVPVLDEPGLGIDPGPDLPRPVVELTA
jgi:L-alanine-DL-glutamate epimerase-like enolase superfamily enzyme